MTAYRFCIVFCIFSILFAGPLSSFGQEPEQPSSTIKPWGLKQATPPPPLPLPKDRSQMHDAPPIKKIGPGIFEVGGVRIIKNENRVEFPAKVNMSKGLLEYSIVGDMGKLHESLLRTSIEPFSLQVALLMLGLEGTTNPLHEQGDPRKPEGDPVRIWVIMKKGDSTSKIRIEDWIVLKDSTGKSRPMPHTDFIFTGSIVHEGVFMAQVEKSIAALFHDPSAMIDNPLPEGGSDELWFVNQESVLPVGTEVIVSIEAKKKMGRKQ